ncbi:MAG: hypothetical protein R6V56_07015 [Lentisphaeria bacterium]
MNDERMMLTIDPDGTGHCLYGERIDLQTLGTLECRRASHIEFDAELPVFICDSLGSRSYIYPA